MLKSHYAPRKPLYLNNISENIERFSDKKIAVLSFRPIETLAPSVLSVCLSEEGNISEAAQHLFAALRALDNSESEVILAETLPEVGLGRAVNDRLRRAAVS
jgi:L-threonylcarbamoyladenylate synthase